MNSRWWVVLAATTALGLAGPAYAAGDVAKGKAKSKSCVGCHGKNGKGVKKNPPLAGKAEAALAKALREYKSGARKHNMMKMLAKRLSDKDIDNLAAYYASLK